MGYTYQFYQPDSYSQPVLKKLVSISPYWFSLTTDVFLVSTPCELCSFIVDMLIIEVVNVCRHYQIALNNVLRAPQKLCLIYLQE